MKLTYRFWSKSIAAFFGGVILALTMMTIAFILPDEPIYQNVKESMNTLQAEGDYPRLRSHMEGTQLDLFTDSIILMHAAYKEGDHNAFDRALHAYEAWQDDAMPVQILSDYMDGKTNYYESDYTRYWHGYLVVLRPLLLLFNYRQIRVVMMITEILLVLAVAALLWKKHRPELSCIFMGSMLFFLPPTTWLALQYASMTILMLISVLIFLVLEKKIKHTEYILLYFLCIGMATSFFDFLTYPLITLAFPMIFWLLLTDGKTKDHFWKLVLKMVQMVLFWGCGYAFFWAMKWIIGTIFIGPEILSKAMEVLASRASSDVAGETEALGSALRIAAIKKNILIYAHKSIIFAGAGIVFAECAIFSFLNHKKGIVIGKKKKDLPVLLLYAAMAVSPLLWYFVIANHSYIHFWFTYRNLAISVFALLALLVELFRQEKAS